MDNKIEELARKIAKKHEQQCEDGGPNYHTNTSIVNAMIEFKGYETALEEKWISVETALPPMNEVVLGFGIDGVTKVRDFCSLTSKGLVMQNKVNKKVKVTFWTRLPEFTPPIQKH